MRFRSRVGAANAIGRSKPIKAMSGKLTNPLSPTDRDCRAARSLCGRSAIRGPGSYASLARNPATDTYKLDLIKYGLRTGRTRLFTPQRLARFAAPAGVDREDTPAAGLGAALAAFRQTALKTLRGNVHALQADESLLLAGNVAAPPLAQRRPELDPCPAPPWPAHTASGRRCLSNWTRRCPHQKSVH